MIRRIARLARPRAWVVLTVVIGLGTGTVQAASPDPSAALPSPAASTTADASPAASLAPAASTLHVAALEIEPFVIKDGDRAAGFSVDVWDEIALRAGYESDLTWVDDIDSLLEAVRSGRADVGIGPISMTPEREEDLDFSYAYSTGGLGIMIATAGVGPVEAFLESVFRPGWLIFGVVLALLIIIVGLFIWVPRRGKEGWPADARTGLHESAWRSARAFLNSSFGEHEPRSGLGRLAAIIWIVAGIIFTSLFTAAVTSNATVSQLQGAIAGPRDLAGKRIVSVAEGTSAEWLTGNGFPWRRVDSLDEAYQALLDRTADALVFDQLILRYHATAESDGQLAVVGPSFELDPYGLALQQGSPEREAIDTALLSMIHDGTADALHTRWFGATQ